MASKWKTVSLPSLAGVFDARSRPADLPPGALRWVQNWAVNDSGKRCRSAGFQRLLSDQLYKQAGGTLCTGETDGCVYKNSDFHDQGGSREPVRYLQEITSSTSVRHLWLARSKDVHRYDEATGLWTSVGTMANAGQFSMACLKDHVLVTNNADPVRVQTLPNASVPVSWQESSGLLTDCSTRRVRVLTSFYGFILAMNVTQQVDGGWQEFTSRVRWCDLNKPLDWIYNGTSSLANFQDLDYGDDIIAAKQLGGSLIIYTLRAIWRCYVNSVDSSLVFGFQRLYSEPKNQTGCLAYPNTLVSTGDAHYYWARDGIYKFTLSSPEPERVGWIHAASAVIFSGDYPDTRVDPSLCNYPVAEYSPAVNELRFSWADQWNVLNRHTLVCNIQFQTCAYEDEGYTALCNYTPTAACNTNLARLVGACGRDYGLKELGGVYFREYLSVADENYTTPITSAVYYQEGYNSVLRGLIPDPWPSTERTIRMLSVDHDTVEDSDPCRVWLKIGNSFHVQDPNSTDPKRQPQWNTYPFKLLEPPESEGMAAMKAKNLRPDEMLQFPVYDKGAFLYYDLTVAGSQGPAIGGNSAWGRLDFDLRPDV